jgi:hypothetical protein
MLAKDPAERFASPRDLLKELRSLQIDGVDLQWPAELDELNSVEAASLSTGRGEVTQRLQEAMKTQALVTRGKRQQWWFAAAFVIGAMLLGAGAAWATRERFLLDVPESQLPAVERMQTAADQFRLASVDRTEIAWKSVEKEFPKDRRWVLQSKEELAKLYLEKQEYSRALPLFEELATVTFPDGPTEKQFRAFGLAGLAWVYSTQNEPEKSKTALKQLLALFGTTEPDRIRELLNDREMVGLVRRVMDKNRDTADQNTRDAFEVLLNSYQAENEG